MPSLISGFEYDIFISYRHNDNRSGWVTEFVKALEEELAATIKEPVSVYFDVNPHDGLHETHDVDDSLKGKLKCLIFIPVISQTYCDPKAFAWKNEFLSFKRMAGEDQFGLKVKLQNGNVASRILPVRIHDLEETDKRLIETELGVLRSVDFIYRSAGVIRPLLAHEDDVKANIDHTFYRDQINKVVRAVKELIVAMQTPSVASKSGVKSEELISPRKRAKLAWVAWGLLLLGIMSFSVFYFVGHKEEITDAQNSIAVLPFDNLSNDPEQDYFCDGTTEQVISSLARLNDLKVIARTSVMQYKKTTKTIAQIGKELNVTHVLESSVRKSGHQIRVTAQLIAVRDESHLWSEDFDNKLVTDILQIQDEVATKIAAPLKNKLLPEEKEKLKSEKPSNPEAYEHYLKGEYMHGIYFSKFLNEDYLRAEAEFKNAIALDSNYATPRAALSNLYDTRANIATSAEERNEYRQLSGKLAKTAFRLNPNLPYSLLAQFENWRHDNSTESDRDSAFKYARLAFQASPNSGLINSEFGKFYITLGLPDNALHFAKHALAVSPGPSRYALVGAVYGYLQNHQAADEYLEKALELEPNNVLALIFLFNLRCDQQKLAGAEHYLDKMKKINPEQDCSDFEARLLAEKGEKEKALAKRRNAGIYVILKMKEEALAAMENKDPLNYLEYRNPRFNFLRGDPRFEKIVARAKELYELRLRKYGQINFPND
jgi:TolB-like protein/Tfp pilus assembly protein PilF